MRIPFEQVGVLWVMNDSFLDSVVATMRVEKIKVMDFLNMSRFHGILMMKHIIANRHE